jgi:hypothetical protein
LAQGDAECRGTMQVTPGRRYWRMKPSLFSRVPGSRGAPVNSHTSGPDTGSPRKMRNCQGCGIDWHRLSTHDGSRRSPRCDPRPTRRFPQSAARTSSSSIDESPSAAPRGARRLIGGQQNSKIVASSRIAGETVASPLVQATKPGSLGTICGIGRRTACPCPRSFGATFAAARCAVRRGHAATRDCPHNEIAVFARRAPERDPRGRGGKQLLDQPHRSRSAAARRSARCKSS